MFKDQQQKKMFMDERSGAIADSRNGKIYVKFSIFPISGLRLAGGTFLLGILSPETRLVMK